MGWYYPRPLWRARPLWKGGQFFFFRAPVVWICFSWVQKISDKPDLDRLGASIGPRQTGRIYRTESKPLKQTKRTHTQNGGHCAWFAFPFPCSKSIFHISNRKKAVLVVCRMWTSMSMPGTWIPFRRRSMP